MSQFVFFVPRHRWRCAESIAAFRPFLGFPGQAAGQACQRLMRMASHDEIDSTTLPCQAVLDSLLIARFEGLNAYEAYIKLTSGELSGVSHRRLQVTPSPDRFD